MRLTKSVEYAIRAMLYLTRKRGHPIPSERIAQAQGIPQASLSAVLRWLAAKRIVGSRSGMRGGYFLPERAEHLSLCEIIEAIHGPIFENDCLIHGAPCAKEGGHWCPVHEVWEQARQLFLKALERYSITDLAARVERWNSVDRMLKELIRDAQKPAP